jgi:NAD(P)-dependent dehydrogenase (short-subunit alcohol dehydrogenase family)
MKGVVLITGASSGIGRAIALFLAEKGYLVIGASRSGNGGDAEGLRNVQMDVTDLSSVNAVMMSIQREFGSLHAVINSAGLGMLGSIEDSEPEEVEALFRTNFMGMHHICRNSLELLRKGASGYIINITSMAAQMGLPYRGIYCASKFAVEGYSEALSYELAADGIRVVLVEPGDVRTDINTNRKVVGSVSKRHLTNHQALQQQINREVEDGLNPKAVAACIYHILNTDKPRLRYRVAKPQAKFAYYLMRLLPDRAFEAILMKHYKM